MPLIRGIPYEERRGMKKGGCLILTQEYTDEMDKMPVSCLWPALTAKEWQEIHDS